MLNRVSLFIFTARPAMHFKQIDVFIALRRSLMDHYASPKRLRRVLLEYATLPIINEVCPLVPTTLTHGDVTS